jgi:hypothetical protein
VGQHVARPGRSRKRDRGPADAFPIGKAGAAVNSRARAAQPAASQGVAAAWRAS